MMGIEGMSQAVAKTPFLGVAGMSQAVACSLSFYLVAKAPFFASQKKRKNSRFLGVAGMEERLRRRVAVAAGKI
ncbi:MAG: hypothetical protein IKP60_10580 [Treponema sp.]|nr:hypothetical protein [Treponema sp.]